MNFLIKLILSCLFIVSPFIVYSMHDQRNLDRLIGMISDPHNRMRTAEQQKAFDSCLEQLPVDLIRTYEVESTHNSLMHLAVFYGKSLAVKKLLAFKFDLSERNRFGSNPIDIAISKLEYASKSLGQKNIERHLHLIKSSILMIKMMVSKLIDDPNREDYLSYALFLLLKCKEGIYDDELTGTIERFYLKYHEEISVDRVFGRTRSHPGETSFELAINNDLARLLHYFLQVEYINAELLNLHLEDLLTISIQHNDFQLLDALLNQQHLDRMLLVEFLHDQRFCKNPKYFREYILDFIKENCSYLLRTPGDVVQSADGQVMVRKSISRVDQGNLEWVFDETVRTLNFDDFESTHP